MIWWYLWVPLVAVTIFALGIIVGKYGGFDWDPLAFGMIVVAGLTLVACGLVNLVVWPSRANGRTICRQFAKNTGYETKFVIQGFTSTGECLVLAADGRWVSKDSIVINVPAKVTP